MAGDSWPLMTTNTRSEILALLKRNGGHSVSELASSLGLASITVRQHLTRLERDGLTAAEQRNGSVGRAHLVFRLTAKAHAAAFPRGTDRLVELLVREIIRLDMEELSGRSEGDRTRIVLRRLAERQAAEFEPLLQRWPRAERVAFVTEILHVDGGFAEWEKNASGYEVRAYNCIFYRLLQNGDGNGDAGCEWHQTFLSRTLGVEVKAPPYTDRPAHCGRYLVSEVSEG
jgi:predicted ArsR family transcriptional regulator